MVGINYMLVPLTFVGLLAYVTSERKTAMCSMGGFCQVCSILYWRILQPIQES